MVGATQISVPIKMISLHQLPMWGIRNNYEELDIGYPLQLASVVQCAKQIFWAVISTASDERLNVCQESIDIGCEGLIGRAGSEMRGEDVGCEMHCRG